MSRYGAGSYATSVIALAGICVGCALRSTACAVRRDRLWQRYPPCFAALGRPRRTQALVTLT